MVCSDSSNPMLSYHPIHLLQCFLVTHTPFILLSHGLLNTHTSQLVSASLFRCNCIKAYCCQEDSVSIHDVNHELRALTIDVVYWGSEW
jgi:hypothetical protein